MATAVDYSDVQRKLQALYPELGLVVTGKNDVYTVDAVKRFQSANHLTVDGIVGPKTLAALTPSASAAAAASQVTGRIGVDYTAVQLALQKEFPNFGLKVSGVNDSDTVEAVKQYQAKKGLTVDGIVGPNTLKAMGIAVPITGLIPNKMTPLTPEVAAQLLAQAYLKVTGEKPSEEILSLLLGQSALETANWKSLHNYNFGNKKASSGDALKQQFRCSEILNGKEVFIDPPDPRCTFAAYNTPLEGAIAYVRLLNKNPDWWKGLQSGDPADFVDGLTTPKAKYFTADPGLYLKVLLERMGKFSELAVKYGDAGIGIMTVGLALASFFLGRKLISSAKSAKRRA